MCILFRHSGTVNAAEVQPESHAVFAAGVADPQPRSQRRCDSWCSRNIMSAPPLPWRLLMAKYDHLAQIKLIAYAADHQPLSFVNSLKACMQDLLAAILARPLTSRMNGAAPPLS